MVQIELKIKDGNDFTIHNRYAALTTSSQSKDLDTDSEAITALTQYDDDDRGDDDDDDFDDDDCTAPARRPPTRVEASSSRRSS